MRGQEKCLLKPIKISGCSNLLIGMLAILTNWSQTLVCVWEKKSSFLSLHLELKAINPESPPHSKRQETLLKINPPQPEAGLSVREIRS